MAYGGRWLYRELVRLGFDPAEVVVTDLDSDYRVHPSYFGYLTWTFLTDPDRYRRLYQPVPMFHNNLWQTPMPVRLIAVGRDPPPDVALADPREAHQLQRRTPSASRPSTRWTTGRPTRSRRTAASTGRPSSGTAASSGRSRSSSRSTATRCERARIRGRSSPSTSRSGAGPGVSPTSRSTSTTPSTPRDPPRPPYPPARRPVARPHQLGDRTLRHHLRREPAAPAQSGFRPDHARPEPADLRVGAADRAPSAPSSSSCYVEERICPPRPAEWGDRGPLVSRLQWLLLPVVGLIFSNLPALDAQTRLMTGRYLEYRVTEKA